MSTAAPALQTLRHGPSGPVHPPAVSPQHPQDTRAKLIEILSASANGCLAELNYDPNRVAQLFKEHQQWQQENVKLYEDNSKLSQHNSWLRQQMEILQLSPNDTSRALARLRDENAALIQERDALRQKIRALEEQHPTGMGYRQLHEKYLKLRRAKADLDVQFRNLQSQLQGRLTQRQSLSIAGPMPTSRSRPSSKPGTPVLQSHNVDKIPQYLSRPVANEQGHPPPPPTSAPPRASGSTCAPPQSQMTPFLHYQPSPGTALWGAASSVYIPGHYPTGSAAFVSDGHPPRSVQYQGAGRQSPVAQPVPQAQWPAPPSRSNAPSPIMGIHLLPPMPAVPQPYHPSPAVHSTHTPPVIPAHSAVRPPGPSMNPPPPRSLTAQINSEQPRTSNIAPPNPVAPPTRSPPLPPQNAPVPSGSVQQTAPIPSPHSRRPSMTSAMARVSIDPRPSSLERLRPPAGFTANTSPVESTPATPHQSSTQYVVLPVPQPAPPAPQNTAPNETQQKRAISEIGSPHGSPEQNKRQKLSTNISMDEGDPIAPVSMSREYASGSFNHPSNPPTQAQPNQSISSPASSDSVVSLTQTVVEPVQQETQDDEGEEEEEEWPLGPDGLRLASDLLEVIFEQRDNDGAMRCQLCLGRAAAGVHGAIEPPWLLNQSEEALVAHCAEEHGPVWDDLRHGR